MTKPFFVFLAPLGCLLMLLFTSLTPYRMMSQIGGLLKPNGQLTDVTSMASIGGLGALLFGLGMMCFLILRRTPSAFARALLVFGALLMFAGAAFNLCGDWLMMSAFHDLATAETVEAPRFLDSFRFAKPAMLAGYILLLAATVDIATAATMITEPSDRRARTAVTIGVISFVFLLLMMLWGQTSILPFPQHLAGDTVEPSRLAASVNGVLRSDFLMQGSIIGLALATLIWTVTPQKQPVEE